MSTKPKSSRPSGFCSLESLRRPGPGEVSVFSSSYSSACRVFRSSDRLWLKPPEHDKARVASGQRRPGWQGADYFVSSEADELLGADRDFEVQVPQKAGQHLLLRFCGRCWPPQQLGKSLRPALLFWAAASPGRLRNGGLPYSHLFSWMSSTTRFLISLPRWNLVYFGASQVFPDMDVARQHMAALSAPFYMLCSHLRMKKVSLVLPQQAKKELMPARASEFPRLSEQPQGPTFPRHGK